jgi:Icc-related predicted phosphoesterase
MSQSSKLRLLITSDLHQHIPKWQDLCKVVCESKPDFVLVCGDLLPKSGLAEQKSFFEELRRYFSEMRRAAGVRPLLYFGNDDYHFLEPLLDELEAEGLCINMNGRVYRDKGLVFCGMNRVRDYPFGYKHWCAPDGDFVVCDPQYMGEGMTFDDSGNEVRIPNLRTYLLQKRSLRDELNSLLDDLTAEEVGASIWMVHQPPTEKGMDIILNGTLIGSPTVHQFVAENQPLLGCSGHAHESPYMKGGRWFGRIGNTLWIQPGQMGERIHYVALIVTSERRAEQVEHSIFGKAEETIR